MRKLSKRPARNIARRLDLVASSCAEKKPCHEDFVVGKFQSCTPENKKTVPFWKDVFLNKKLKPFIDKDLSTKYKLHFDEVEYLWCSVTTRDYTSVGTRRNTTSFFVVVVQQVSSNLRHYTLTIQKKL